MLNNGDSFDGEIVGITNLEKVVGNIYEDPELLHQEARELKIKAEKKCRPPRPKGSGWFLNE